MRIPWGPKEQQNDDTHSVNKNVWLWSLTKTFGRGQPSGIKSVEFQDGLLLVDKPHAGGLQKSQRRLRSGKPLSTVVSLTHCAGGSTRKLQRVSLKENNIHELTYDEHWSSARRNSGSWMLLAIFIFFVRSFVRRNIWEPGCLWD